MPARRRPRRQPRGALRRQGSLPQAVSARDGAREIAPADFSVARDAYGAPRVVCERGGAGACSGATGSQGIRVSLTHDARSASAVALALPAMDRRAVARAAALSPAAATPRGGAGQPAARVRRCVAGRGDRCGSRRRTTRTSGGCCRVPPLPLAVGASGGARWSASRTSTRCVDALGREGRADPDRSFRQLRGGDRRRASTSSRRRAAASISCAGRSSPAGWTVGDAPVPPRRLRRRCPSAVRSTPSSRGSRPASSWCSRSISTPAGKRRHRRRVLRPSRRHIQQPGVHRARDRRAGRAGRQLARARRTPRAALRAPLALIEHADADEAIRLNTRAYNAALEQLVLRHPEQWWWMHRRWKTWPMAPRRVQPGAAAPD